MFKRISFRPPGDASLSTEVQMAQKVRLGGIAYGVVVAGSSLLWLAPVGSMLMIGAIFWERSGPPWTTIAPSRPSRTGAKRCGLPSLHDLLVACLYSAVPLSGILSGERVGWFVAIMAFCTAVISENHLFLER